MIKDGLWCAFNGYHMGNTAENVAVKWQLTRDEQDAFAAASQQKVEAAQQAGRFVDEIVPVTVSSRKGDTIVDADEYPKAGTTVETLGKLRPAFAKDGTVTAGNASGINDGAAAVVLMSADEAAKRGVDPLARIVSWATAGVDPAIMGTGPIPASRAALDKAGWTVDDLDLIEANGAFAAQACAVNKDLGWDTDKVNVNGGRHRHRPSDRRLGNAHLHHPAARDAASRRPQGPGDAVHWRRHGHRHVCRARLSRAGEHRPTRQKPLGGDTMGRVAIVTGGTRGIGRAVSEALKEAGYSVAANYGGNDEAANAFKDETGIPVYKFDVGNFDACAEAIAKITDDLGPVEVLVNNAGITRDSTLHRMTREQWSEVMSTNMDSLFNLTRNVIEGMRERGFGRIVNISSINGQKGQLGQANYSAAKAGVIGFTKAVAQENAPKGITVNAIAPGYIGTEMVLAVPADFLKDKVISQIPVGRLGEPEEVARCVVFLASDDAGFVTGATMTVNGGQYLT